jgi:hypothetical protein
MSLSEKISTASQAADIEMSEFLKNMSESERSTYAGQNMTDAINRVKAAKSDRFQYLSEDLTGADNNITSTAYYITRTQDLTELATDVDEVAAKQVSTSVINTDLIKRQKEINEWANSNKLDTLFFLQVLFLTLTFISSMVFLNSRGLISSYLLNLFIVLSSAFAVFILITRARYTSVLRDGRYWNKLRFGQAMNPPKFKAPPPSCPGDPIIREPAEETPTPPNSCNNNLESLGDLPAPLAAGWGGTGSN